MVLQILEMCFWTSATCVEGCVDWMNVLGVWANATCFLGAGALPWASLFPENEVFWPIDRADNLFAVDVTLIAMTACGIASCGRSELSSVIKETSCQVSVLSCAWSLSKNLPDMTT